MSVKERLITFAKSQEKSVRAFEINVGLTVGYINAIRVSIQPDKLQSIASKYPNLNTGWLMTGEGPMLKGEIGKKDKINPKVSFENGKGRPYYDVDWTLGFENINDDTIFHPEFNIDFPPANKDSIEWFRGKGQSMLGEIDSGDYIALEEVKDTSWFPLGRVYGIVTSNGFRTIKRIVSLDKDNYLLVSSNPDKDKFPDQPLPKNMIHRLYKIKFVIKDLDE